jgi:uracil-DNA glycosylase
MRVSECVGCERFPCTDVRPENYVVPSLELNPETISIIMISEAAPPDRTDYYYAGGDALFEKTTVQAFNDAGERVSSIREVVALGAYLTTAVKCGKVGYAIGSDTIKECSFILEREVALFSHAKALLLMGDVSIKAVNQIARRAGEARVIPPGSTYKIRGQPYFYRGIRAFPSYLQAGPSFFIEKSKRQMIAEDIASALTLIRS